MEFRKGVKNMRYVLIIALVLGLACSVFCQTTTTAKTDFLSGLTGGVLSTPLSTDLITAYSLRKGAVEAGAGYGFLNIASLNLDIAIIGSQKDATASIVATMPLKTLQKGLLTIIWPELANLQGGAYIGWGYDLSSDPNGNTYFNWQTLPDFGLTLLLRY